MAGLVFLGLHMAVHLLAYAGVWGYARVSDGRWIEEPTNMGLWLLANMGTIWISFGLLLAGLLLDWRAQRRLGRTPLLASQSA